MKRVMSFVVAAVLLLAACGPADVNDASNTAVAAVGTAIPSEVADLVPSNVADLVPSDAADQIASAVASAVPGLEETVNAVVSDPTVNAVVNEALAGLVPDDLRLQRDQQLVLDTTREVADVTNYRWTVAEVPAGAEAVKGQQISENSDGKLTIEPTDYAKYFPVAGTYIINLELTYTAGNKDVVPIELLVP